MLNNVVSNEEPIFTYQKKVSFQDCVDLVPVEHSKWKHESSSTYILSDGEVPCIQIDTATLLQQQFTEIEEQADGHEAQLAVETQYKSETFCIANESISTINEESIEATETAKKRERRGKSARSTKPQIEPDSPAMIIIDDQSFSVD